RFSRGKASCLDARAIHPCIACRDTPGNRPRLTGKVVSASSVGNSRGGTGAPWDGSAWPAHGMRDAPDAVSAGPRSAGGVAGLQELLDQLLVEVWEGFQVGDANVFVDFV